MKQVFLSIIIIFSVNFSFSQNIANHQKQKEIEQIFDKAKADIFCVTAQHINKNFKDLKYDTVQIDCHSIKRIITYFQKKAPTYSSIFSKVSTNNIITGRNINKEISILNNIIKEFRRELSKNSNYNELIFDDIKPKLDKIVHDAESKAHKVLKKQNADTERDSTLNTIKKTGTQDSIKNATANEELYQKLDNVDLKIEKLQSRIAWLIGFVILSVVFMLVFIIFVYRS